MLGLYGPGFIDFVYDEMELGTRVAHFLDSENNTPEVHFLELVLHWQLRNNYSS